MPVEFGLLITPEDTSANNLKSAQKQLLTSNIPPATITKDKSLTAIFPFEFKETITTLLFSGAALEAKPITMMYTDAKVDEQSIKLIFDSGSAGHQVDHTVSARIFTADGVTKMSIGEIDEFPFEVNGIITLIKVLVIKATQYQALVGNNWLINGQHTHVPATCGHFKVLSREEPLIKLKEEEKKSIWEAYQEREKKKKNLPGEQTKNCGVITAKGKGKEQEEEPKQTTSSTHILYVTLSQNAYRRPKLVCVNCGKKLSTIDTCCRKWDGTLCLACGDTLLDKGIGGACDETCQYTILINN
ncbi:hypothetical protein G9A89_014740 [Geosiphon pyriformis]|nr:hypothetical protein G9A89_014740 [Geosiphon pyriformis]